MEREQENKINDNGAYVRKETIKQTPKDGFVSDTIMEPVNPNAYGKYHKGNRTTVSYSTNDPRITRPFVYGMCSLFFIIGIILLLCKMWIMSICFIAMSLFVFNKSKKDIDAVAEELKKQGQDVTIDSKEEAKQILNGVTEDFKNGFDEAKKATFTKEAFKNFLKLSIPIYSVIAVIVSLLITIFINIFLGIILMILFILIGLGYYYIISKICKY